METRVRKGELVEDRFTGGLEAGSARMPSSAYLGFAIASMAISAVLKAKGKNDWALFVGQWAPAFLTIGVYNKLVKQHGSDNQVGQVAA